MSTQVSARSFTKLYIPILLETLCSMLAGMVDTVMLSTVGDAAVGAVGTANTYTSLFIIMFNIVSSGMTAVMTQYIGAKKAGVAYQARQLGLVFSLAAGTLLSLFLFAFSGNVLEVVGAAPLLMDHAKTYLRIVGSFLFLNALIPVFSNYLRAFGHTRPPLAAALLSNGVNLILNALFLFVFHSGVAGVAAATVISRALNLAIVMTASRLLVHAKEDPERMRGRDVFAQIIRVGLPSALETAAYHVAMTLTIRFLNQMDSEGLNVTARAYAVQITNFSFCAAAALASTNAILTGWRIGEGDYESCDRGTKRAACIGIAIAAGLAPSARGELEITDVNLEYLRRDSLRVIPLEDNYVWLDAGSADSLLTAAQTIHALQHGGRYVGCIEECAFRQGWITEGQLRALGQPMAMTAYGQYLLSIQL